MSINQDNYEKNRREDLLKRMNSVNQSQDKSDTDNDSSYEANEQIWQYELEQYRKRKKLDKFFTYSSILGIIGFVLSLIVAIRVFIIG